MHKMPPLSPSQINGNQLFKILLDKRQASKKVVLGNWVPHSALTSHRSLIPRWTPFPVLMPAALQKRNLVASDSLPLEKTIVRRHGVVGISVGPVQVQ